MARIVLDLPDDDPRTKALMDALQAFGATIVDDKPVAPPEINTATQPAANTAPPSENKNVAQPSTQPRRVLVTGGARSGKSSYAEQLFAGCDQVDYVATSQRNEDDPEWMARIAAHVARRPSSWRTIETTDIEQLLATDGAPVLVDCLGVWLTRLLDQTDFWNQRDQAEPLVRQRITSLSQALRDTPRQVVLVTNEVGAGVVPADAGTRGFRDMLGILNAQIGDVCDAVVLCVAGRAIELPDQLTIPGFQQSSAGHDHNTTMGADDAS